MTNALGSSSLMTIQLGIVSAAPIRQNGEGGWLADDYGWSGKSLSAMIFKPRLGFLKKKLTAIPPDYIRIFG